MDALDPFQGFQRTQHCSEVSESDLGKEVRLVGWVHRRRDHGGVIFVDLRDREGTVQAVFNPQFSPESHRKADALRNEFVIGVQGVVSKRPEGMANPKLKTGALEVMATELLVFNRSKVLPFNLDEDLEVDESLRLRYRYLDLRRPAMAAHFALRHKVSKMTRDYFDRHGFYEIETPYLTRSTPEGARDYLVPSRITPGSFYALPQSPQLLKQILMVAGMDRYFQIVRCFRDEDLRADRQPEFTQVDLEMSFVDQDQLIEIVEGWVALLFEELLDRKLPRPFPRMSYADAIEAYGVDNPDTRYGLKMKEVTETVRGSEFQVFRQVIEKGGVVKAVCFPEGARLSRRELDNLDGMAKDWGAGGVIWAKCTADGIQSPIAKFLSDEVVRGTLERMKAREGDLLLIMAGAPEEVNPWMGRLRAELAQAYDFIDPNEFAFTWIMDFPLFERNKEGEIASKHHPFTAPREEDFPLLDKDPEACRSLAYDLVLNGTEIGGGSIRIHQVETQKRILSILGISEAEAEEKFGFLLDALAYGAPPHGGIAFGLDRLVMILAGAKSLREVIAFPKTQKASCLLTQSPAPVDAEQLRELHVRAVLPKKPASN